MLFKTLMNLNEQNHTYCGNYKWKVWHFSSQEILSAQGRSVCKHGDKLSIVIAWIEYFILSFLLVVVLAFQFVIVYLLSTFLPLNSFANQDNFECV